MKKIIQFFKDYNRWCEEVAAPFRASAENRKYVLFEDIVFAFELFFLPSLVYLVMLFS